MYQFSCSKPKPVEYYSYSPTSGEHTTSPPGSPEAYVRHPPGNEHPQPTDFVRSSSPPTSSSSSGRLTPGFAAAAGPGIPPTSSNYSGRLSPRFAAAGPGIPPTSSTYSGRRRPRFAAAAGPGIPPTSSNFSGRLTPRFAAAANSSIPPTGLWSSWQANPAPPALRAAPCEPLRSVPVFIDLVTSPASPKYSSHSSDYIVPDCPDGCQYCGGRRSGGGASSSSGAGAAGPCVTATAAGGVESEMSPVPKGQSLAFSELAGMTAPGAAICEHYHIDEQGNLHVGLLISRRTLQVL